jgi:hypothetical protein
MTLLTVDELREHVTTSLGDDALQRLLDDAEAAITAYAGEVGAAVEIVSGGSPTLTVGRPIESITSVRERDGWQTPTTLATDDYEQIGPFVLGRLRYGTNSAPTWRGPVRVTYAPVDDTATREIVQLELVKLAISFNPALASETVGAWTQTFVSSQKTYPEQRGDILARLRYVAAFAVV